MKKVIAVFIAVLGFVFSALSVNASGYTIYDNIETYPLAKPVTLGLECNVMRGVGNKEALRYNETYQMLLHLENKIMKGSFDVVYRYIHAEHHYPFHAEAKYFGGRLKQYIVTADDEIIYQLDCNNGEATITTNKEFHPLDIDGTLDDKAAFETVSEAGGSRGLVFVNGFNQEQFNRIDFDSKLFGLVLGAKMKYNTKYNGKDVHLVVEQDNQVAIEELLKNVVITDQSDKTPISYSIIQNEYTPQPEAPLEIGTYKVRLLAKDKSNNAVIQDVFIDVVDGKGPNVTLSDIEVSYDKELTEADILERVIIADTSEIQSKIVDLKTYPSNKRVVGSYPIDVIITDIYGNQTKTSANIRVVDKVAPVVVTKDLYVGYPYKKLTLEEIKKSIVSVTDGLDGAIDISKVELFEDTDDYDNNYHTHGSYYFQWTVSDKAGNSLSFGSYVIVCDMDMPEIDLGEYAIVVSKGQTLTRTEIINILKASGQIAQDESPVLNSLYFDTEEPLGDYDIEVVLENGEILHSKITVMDTTPNISFDEPEKHDDALKKDNTPIIALGSVLGLSLVAVGILVLRKRH